jgi:integrase
MPSVQSLLVPEVVQLPPQDAALAADSLEELSVYGFEVEPFGKDSFTFARLLEKADLPPITRFHDLRHTCATLLLSQNVNPKIVSEMLGHSSIAITLDTYSHVLPTMQEIAIRAMEDVLK